ELALSFCFVCCLCFFFSSRRRHTRFSRDWSSDVCSSDLVSTINKLRGVRGLPNAYANTKSAVMALIEHERMVELAFEGHRFWDLRRWRKAHTVLNGVQFTGHKYTGFNYEVVPADNTDRSFTGALYYLPIPEMEVQRNNALDQIKGW